jgi:hypothetical protein
VIGVRAGVGSAGALAKEGAMNRRALASLLAAVALAPAASAQAPARLRWQVGQVLTYRVEHTTQDNEVTADASVERKTHLSLVKSWQVVDVDKDGVATVRLWLRRLVWETTKPGGDVLRYDSTDPEKSTPELKESFGKYFKEPLAVLRLDGLGRVVQVKESRFGPASRFDVEVPFVTVLPEAGLAAGKEWERPFQITLEPPQGTGEKYPAVQRCTCKSVADNQATVALTTALKSPPEAAGDLMPLLDKLPEGEVVFDLASGRMIKATMKVEKEVKAHMGEGSSYKVQSSYVEQYVGDR